MRRPASRAAAGAGTGGHRRPVPQDAASGATAASTPARPPLPVRAVRRTVGSSDSWAGPCVG
ncbi:hypothetical protein EASAB2608_05437 [Streptomyces sp. EAS-AB2608]|nr:hypothetical protein EASAB2608_05437 [Streptomyces sp. EAS-AB2608]